MRFYVRVLNFRRCVHIFEDFIGILERYGHIAFMNVISTKNIALILKQETASRRKRLSLNTIRM
jgi:hypothetical protein